MRDTGGGVLIRNWSTLNVWTGQSVFARQSKISQIPSKYLGICYRNLLLLVKVSLVGPQPSSREQITLSSSRAKFREGNDLIWSALLLHSFCPSLDVMITPELLSSSFTPGGHHSSPRSTHPLLTFDASSSLARSLVLSSAVAFFFWSISVSSLIQTAQAILPRLFDMRCLQECDDQVA